MSNMTATRLLAGALLAASLTAQGQFCGDNDLPIRIVTTAGAPLPTVIINGEPYAQAADKGLALAIDHRTPTGRYYVQLTNIEITEVLSTTPLVQRIFTVTNPTGNAPVITDASNRVVPYIPLEPFRATESPWTTCLFKAWMGNCYDPSWNPATHPLGLPFGVWGSSGNQCCVRSFSKFRIGTGTGSTVSGVLFNDLDRNGSQGTNEPGIPGCPVRLVGPTGTQNTSTGNNGEFAFGGLTTAGRYTLEVTPCSGYSATTPTVYELDLCGCEPAVRNFGATMGATCNGRTPGFWRNRNGVEIITVGNYLTLLGGLNVVDANGNRFTTSSIDRYRAWMAEANATNMAYMLSVHLTAMTFNIQSGNVSRNCTVRWGHGTIAIGDLVAQAIASLLQDPLTRVGHPARAAQTMLKDALDAANNNLNWL